MDPGLIELARWWSWRRQRLDRTSRGVEDCLRSVVGVTSVNPWGPLSLLARVPRLLKGGAVEGVIDTKRAIRIPAMRRGLHLVPTDTAHLVFWATKTAAEHRRLRREGIDEREYERVKRAVLEVARAPKRADEIAASIRHRPTNLSVVLDAMCADGDLLAVKADGITSNDFTYAATSAWLGAELKRAEPAEALVWLAGDYLTGFGPVTADDLAWWAGVSRAKAEDALLAHDPVDVGGGQYIHARDERAFSHTRPHLGRVSLLPRFDSYTMGYAPDSRARFASHDALPLVYDASGRSLPVVLVEGEVRGRWEHRVSGARARVRLSMFEEPGPRLREALQAEAGLVGGFLEAQATSIELSIAPARPARKKAAREPVKKALVRKKAPKEAARKPAKKQPAKKKPARKPAKPRKPRA